MNKKSSASEKAPKAAKKTTSTSKAAAAKKPAAKRSKAAETTASKAKSATSAKKSSTSKAKTATKMPTSKSAPKSKAAAPKAKSTQKMDLDLPKTASAFTQNPAEVVSDEIKPPPQVPPMPQATAEGEQSVFSPINDSAKDPLKIYVSDTSIESQMYNIMDKLFSDIASNPQYAGTRLGGISITMPSGGALKLSQENLEKLQVIHILFHKLMDDEAPTVQEQFKAEYCKRIGQLVIEAGDHPIEIKGLVKELFNKLPPEKRK